MLLKVAENITNLKNTESCITVTHLGVFIFIPIWEGFLHTLTVIIYSTTITLRPTHGDAITTVNEKN